MPALARRGFTLIELMIALVLLGIVSGAIYQVLVNNQRVYQAQTQQIDLQQNLRAAATILPGEFRELDAADGDIQGPLSATSMTIRAMRKLGFICVAPVLGGGVGNISITVRKTPMFGRTLSFGGNDSLLVFFEGKATSRNDDTWLPAQVKGVTGGTCVLDPNPLNQGFVLQLQPQWLGAVDGTGKAVYNWAGAIPRGSPVRQFETVTYRVYQASDGKWYLGYESVYPPATIQPLIGPLTGSAGVEFDYYDSTGAVTTVPNQVALIDIHLRAQTATPVRSGGAQGAIDYKVDSLTTRVALRNNPRCGPCQ